MPYINEHEGDISTSVFIPYGMSEQANWRGEGDYKMSNEIKVSTSINKSTVFSLMPAKGDKGDKGDPGESAYTIAVQNGFPGSEQEWEQLMADTYENARIAQESAALADDVKEYVQGIVDEGLGTQYYNKTEVDAIAAGKADSFSTYTKNQVDNMLLNGYYTKNVVDTIVSDAKDQSLSRDSTLLNAVNGLSYLKVEHHTGTITAGTSSASGTYSISFVPTQGYTPIGVVGYHASNSYLNFSRITVEESSTAGTFEIKFTYRYFGSVSSSAFTVGAYVLCAKEIELSPFS